MTTPYTGAVLYFIKYLVMYGFIMVVLPWFLYTNLKEDFLKNTLLHYIRISFYMILLGYLLVWLKLYEFITFFLIVLFLIAFKYYKRAILSGSTELDLVDDVQVLVINHVDRVERIGTRLMKYLARRSDELSDYFSAYFKKKGSLLLAFLLCLVFLFGGYLFFTDSLFHAAPPAGESYQNIARMKYLGARNLFYDGIYPQGFYLIHETLQKTIQIDHLYLNHFTGGLNCLLLAVSLYYFVSRLCKSSGCGLLAVILYFFGGIFRPESVFLPIAGPEQFANLFVFPVLYFFYEYTQRSRSEDFYGALTGASLIGLCYPGSYSFVVLGVLCMILATIIRDMKNKLRKSVELLAMIVMSAIVTIAPLSLGLLFGREFSEESLKSIFQISSNLTFPQLGWTDFLALGALLVILIQGFFRLKNKEYFTGRLFLFLFGTVAFVIYYFWGAQTKSVYLAKEAIVLWSLLLPLLIAVGLSPVFEGVKKLFRLEVSSAILSGVILVVFIVLVKPIPAIPPKQEFDSMAEQYLKISQNYRPTRWMMVSWKESYPLVLGNGYHMMIDEFIKNYSPTAKQLIDYDSESVLLDTEDIFLVREKRIFEGIPQEEFEKRQEYRKKMQEWLLDYSKNHDNLTLYYEDEILEIWNIHQEIDREEEIRRLWER